MGGSLRLELLGKPEISLNGQPVTRLQTAKTEALFYYLAVTGQPQPRGVLADLFWPEMPETQAKRNLTQSLAVLRKHLAAYLVVESQWLAFNGEAGYTLDVLEFETKTAQADPVTLAEAIQLYRGDFLEGLYVREALPFEEWLLAQRERLRGRLLETLDSLVGRYAGQSQADLEPGLMYARRLLSLDPLREPAHRQMMLLLARNGQRSAALAQFETCRQVLAEELGVEPSAETTALYQRLKSIDQPPPHNLPAPSDAFVGRLAELNQIAAHLDQPSCRLLTLVGPGGVGKTRLALQAAGRYLQPAISLDSPLFSGGIYLVSLTSLHIPDLSDPARAAKLLVAALANTLGVVTSTGLDPLKALINHLRHVGPMLLLLDNFEYLVESAALLDQLLHQAPHLKFLVTSQERLNLKQEWVLEVGGLEYPREDEVLAGETIPIRQYSAIALFEQRARQVEAGFSLTKTEIADLVRLCQLVEGMPLALELAASWLRSSSCAEIAAGLEQNLDLTTSQRNIPSRHRSLRAVFNQSWERLSAEEQAIFRQLAVFQGGFQREAAEQVAGASLFMLQSLVDKSLLRHSPAGRYSIHELLRQYMGEKLAQVPPEQAAAQDRHSRYYARFLEQRGKSAKGEAEAKILAELGVEADNIRAGWLHAIDPNRASTLAEINQYWYLGRFEQAMGLTQPGPAALRPPDPAWDRGLELQQQGLLAYQQGRYDQARQRLSESLTVLRAADDSLHAARSTVILGMAAYDLGQYADAERLLRQSLAEFDAIGENRYRSYALGYLGRTLLALERPPPGDIEQFLQKSLAINRQVRDGRAVAFALKNLGCLRLRLAETEAERVETKALLQEGLAAFQAVKEPWGLAGTLASLGQLHLSLGEYPEARRHYYQALQLALEGEFIPLVLAIFSGAGELLAQTRPSKRSQEWLALAYYHPVSSCETKIQAQRLLAPYDTALSPELLAARAQEAAAKLASLIPAVLAELAPSVPPDEPGITLPDSTKSYL